MIKALESLSFFVVSSINLKKNIVQPFRDFSLANANRRIYDIQIAAFS